MRSIHWISLGVGLGLVCVLGGFVLLATRFPPRMSAVPAVSVSNSPITHSASVSVPSSPMAPPLSAITSLTASRALTAAQAITPGDWHTFTDLEAGYSIRYPPNSYINSGQSKGQTYRTVDIGFQIPNQRYQGMSVRVEPNPQNLPINQFLNEFYQKVKERPLNVEAASSLEKLEVASIPAYKTNILYGDTQILLPYNRKVYIFSLGYTIAGGGSSPEARAMFSQILGTFQVIP